MKSLLCLVLLLDTECVRVSHALCVGVGCPLIVRILCHSSVTLTHAFGAPRNGVPEPSYTSCGSGETHPAACASQWEAREGEGDTPASFTLYTMVLLGLTFPCFIEEEMRHRKLFLNY